MSNPNSPLQRFIDWILPAGRIDRSTYFKLYVLPALAVLLVSLIVQIHDAIFIAVGILAVGTRKRLNDTGFKPSRRARLVAGGLGTVITVITTIIAFLLFLGGISGMGDEDLLTLALVVFAAPFVLPVLGSLVYALFAESSPDENEHGPIPEAMPDASSGLPGFKGVLKSFGMGMAVLAIGVAGLFVYEELSTRESALIEAIREGNAGAVQALLAEGEDPNQLSRHGATPLMIALSRRDGSEIAALLLEHGADPNQPSYDGNRVTEMSLLQSPIVIVARSFDGASWAEVLQLMIDNGVDLNPEPAHRSERSPILNALSWDRGEAVNMLVKAGARIDVRDESDLSKVLQTAMHDREDTLIRLLITEDTDGSMLSDLISTGDYYWGSKGCETFWPQLERLLKEEVNRRAGQIVFSLSPIACAQS